MPGFLSPWKGVPLLLIPEYSGINKGQRFPDRSKTAHSKPPVKCFLTGQEYLSALNVSDGCSGFGISVLGQWFSNVRVHQNFLRDLLRPKLLDPILRVSNSIGVSGN